MGNSPPAAAPRAPANQTSARHEAGGTMHALSARRALSFAALSIHCAAAALNAMYVFCAPTGHQPYNTLTAARNPQKTPGQ